MLAKVCACECGGVSSCHEWMTIHINRLPFDVNAVDSVCSIARLHLCMCKIVNHPIRSM